MSSLGTAWNGEDSVSAARMNAKTVWVGTGAQLANLSPTYPIQIVGSTTTEDGFVEDTVYYRSADNTQWFFLSMSKHTHNSDTHLAGGLFSDILYANAADYYLLDYGNAKIEDFHSIIGGLGITENDTSSSAGKVIARTGTVSNDYAQLVDYGIRLGFGSKSRFSIKMGFDSTTNLIVRVGVAGEDVNGSNTTSRKYGIEGCDSSGTNWVMYSANGTTRSGTVTTNTALNNGYDSNGIHYRLDHTPNVDIKFYEDGSNCGANCTKSSFVPNSNDTGSDYVVRFGVKTTNTTEKRLTMWGMKLWGRTTDAHWF